MDRATMQMVYREIDRLVAEVKRSPLAVPGDGLLTLYRRLKAQEESNHGHDNNGTSISSN